VPRKVTRPRARTSGENDARRLGARTAFSDLDVAHPQLVDDLLQELTLFGGQVAARFLLEEREDVDHLLRRREIRLAHLASDGIGDVAEVNRGGVSERQHETKERDCRSVVTVFSGVVRLLGHDNREW
jgi:hypothetical protein